MEMEFFVEPGTDERVVRVLGRTSGCSGTSTSGSARRTCASATHEPDELAHYAKAASDIEYQFPFGWGELEGIANRTDFDLKAAPEGERRGPHLLRPGDATSGTTLT